MRKLAICLVIVIALLLDFTVYTKVVTPLFANPLLAACKELKPGMSQHEAITIIEKHHDEGFFQFVGVNQFAETIGAPPEIIEFIWVNFLLDDEGWPVQSPTPSWFPISFEYINAKGLEVGICEEVVCEVEMSTAYAYSQSLIMKIQTPLGPKEITLYPEDAGVYYLEDNCEEASE